MLVVAALLAAGCGGSVGDAQDAPDRGQRALLEAVRARREHRPRRAARGAADQRRGRRLRPTATTYDFRVKRYDDGLSPRRPPSPTCATRSPTARSRSSTRAPASTRRGRRANAAGVPIGIVHQGGSGLVDPQKRPNVFRIVPTDHGLAFRFAEYLSRSSCGSPSCTRTRSTGRRARRRSTTRSRSTRRRSRPASTSPPTRPTSRRPCCAPARPADRAARLGRARHDRGRRARGPAQRLERADLRAAGRAPTRSSARS